MHKQDARCDDLIRTTAGTLNEETVALILFALQRGNVEMSVKVALNR